MCHNRGCLLPIVHQQVASSLIRGVGVDRERAEDPPEQNWDLWAMILHKTELLEFDEEKNDLSVCALDPGIRTFNTVYDNQTIVTEMDPGDVGHIYQLC